MPLMSTSPLVFDLCMRCQPAYPVGNRSGPTWTTATMTFISSRRGSSGMPFRYSWAGQLPPAFSYIATCHWEGRAFFFALACAFPGDFFFPRFATL